MRFAVVSDLHIGDPFCSLVTFSSSSPTLGPKYDGFKNGVGQGNDFLILLGDTLDFSVSSYDETYECAKCFFDQVQKDGLAKEMIFVAGNHDADIWHTVEYQTNIINRIINHNQVLPFRLSVPGIIDDRVGKGEFTLAGVTARPEPSLKYAGLFLDNITDPPTPFNFAYPNVYVVTDNETVLITHGHYLESYWAFTGELALRVAGADLPIAGEPSLQNIVGINFPLSQLACSGVGQSGPLLDVIRLVQKEVKDKNLVKVKDYSEKIKKFADELISFQWTEKYKEPISDLLLSVAKDWILDYLKGFKNARYDKELMDDPSVQQRFINFYNATAIEVERLGLDYPKHVIFGHTHEGISWNSDYAPIDSSKTKDKAVYLHNTGGWLYEAGAFNEAEVFIYDTNGGFKSVTVK
jgi:3',5'-cyclic AMP phosphodiesterase CpdA